MVKENFMIRKAKSCIRILTLALALAMLLGCSIPVGVYAETVTPEPQSSEPVAQSTEPVAQSVGQIVQSTEPQAAVDDGKLRVLITSDVHHSTINWYGKTTDERMQLWVDSIKKEHQTTPIDLIIIAGDTSLDVNGTTGSLLNGGKNYTEEFVDNYVSQLREMNIPVYIMAGNHEPYTNEQWKEMTGNDREFSVRVEGNLFICLDNFESNLDMNTSENPVYTVSDVEFAEQEMSKYPDDNVWLVGHWFETPQTPSYRTPESDGFKALLKNDRIKGLFAGHDHKCDVVTTEAAYGSKIIAKTGNFSYTYYTTSLAPNATNTQITDSMWGFRELVITPTEAYSQYILADTTTLSPVHNNVSISNTRRTVHKVEYDVGCEVVPVDSPVTMKHWHFNTTAAGYAVRFIGTVAVDDLKDYKNAGIEISIKLQGANEYLLDTSYITQNVYDRFVLGANVVEAGEGKQVYAVDMKGFKNGNVYEITFISFLTQTDGTVIYDLNGETTLTVENGKLL